MKVVHRVGREHFGVPDPDFDDDTLDERGKRLRGLASYGDAFIYEYDFGDGWRYLVEVDGVLPRKETPQRRHNGILRARQGLRWRPSSGARAARVPAVNDGVALLRRGALWRKRHSCAR
ncbi:hypothetical protein EPN44_09260 [bacterium]|nr:MAG: hypothetical protein EPN44_09260 [bacterium]